MSRDKSTLLIIFILLALIFSSCNFTQVLTEPTYVPRSDWVNKWLINPTCAPPCFENIIPGKTTMDEAVKLIKQIPGIKIDLYPTSGVPPEDHIFQMQWSYKPPSHGSGVIDTDQSGVTVGLIHINFSTSEKPVTLQEVISAYGEPMHIDLYDCRPGAFANSCAVNIVNNKIGLLIDLFLQDSGNENHQVEILPSERVLSVTFIPVEEDSYYKLMGENNPNFVSNYKEWKGFGIYP
jgi:hypothetical protein